MSLTAAAAQHLRLGIAHQATGDPFAAKRRVHVHPQRRLCLLKGSQIVRQARQVIPAREVRPVFRGPSDWGRWRATEATRNSTWERQRPEGSLLRSLIDAPGSP